MILIRVFLGLVPALMAVLLVAGMVECGAAFDSGVGVTSDGPRKGPGSPNRVLAVRTIFVAGISEERDNEDRPPVGATVRDEWAADRGAADVIAVPSNRAGPTLAWRCATPPTGPPLA